MGTPGPEELLADARRVRDDVARADGSLVNPTFSPAIVQNFDRLIRLAESLLAERAQFESRLHRRSPAAFAVSLDPDAPQQWRDDAPR